MNGTEWLRSLVRRKPRYATGGFVAGPKPGEAPLVPLGQGGCAWPDDSIVARLSVGTVTVPHDAPVSDEVLIVLNNSSATFRPHRQLVTESAQRPCPCIAIYSSCRCTER